MQLTLSDKIAINPEIIEREIEEAKPETDWSTVNDEYGITTARELHEASGLTLPSIYRAAKRGDIEILPAFDIHWPTAAKFSKDLQPKSLAKKLGVALCTVEAAIYRGDIECKQYKTVDERPRDSGGKFK